jgi:hypothetical protein
MATCQTALSKLSSKQGTIVDLMSPMPLEEQKERSEDTSYFPRESQPLREESSSPQSLI